VTRPLAGALVSRIETAEIGRAFDVAAACLLRETEHVDAKLRARLGDAVRELTRSWRA
jgi:hypothetical protein